MLPRMAILSAAACLFAASAAAQHEPASSQQAAQDSESSVGDPRAVKILRAACDFIRGKDAFSTVCEVQRVEVSADQGRTLDLRARLDFRRPNYLRILSEPPRWKQAGKPLEGDNGLPVTTIYCDAKTITYVMPSLGSYIRQAAPPRVSEIFENGLMPDRANFPGVTVYPVFLTEDPFAIMTGGPWKLEYVGRERLDGVPCQVLRQRTEGLVDLRIWIGEDPPVFLCFATDLERAKADKMQVIVPEFSQRFRDWDFSPSLSKRDFVYQPPARLREVESFEERVEGPAPASSPAETGH